MKQTNIYLDDEDWRGVQVILAKHGQRSNAAAIRFAIRETAQRIEDREQRRSRADHDSSGC